jgi:hypothetical protein
MTTTARVSNKICGAHLLPNLATCMTTTAKVSNKICGALLDTLAVVVIHIHKLLDNLAVVVIYI